MKTILASQSNLLELASAQQPQSGLFTVCDSHAASDPLLQLCAHLSLHRTVRVLDCGNRADMYAVARTLRPLTGDPISTMRNVHLSRAFTCYQTETLLSSCHDLERTPILVLDLLSTFLDESVSDSEVRRLFRDSVAHLQRLSGRNIVIVGVKPPDDNIDKRNVLLTELTQLSDDFIWLNDPALMIAEPAEQLSLL